MLSSPWTPFHTAGFVLFQWDLTLVSTSWRKSSRSANLSTLNYDLPSHSIHILCTASVIVCYLPGLSNLHSQPECPFPESWSVLGLQCCSPSAWHRACPGVHPPYNYAIEWKDEWGIWILCSTSGKLMAHGLHSDCWWFSLACSVFSKILNELPNFESWEISHLFKMSKFRL